MESQHPSSFALLLRRLRREADLTQEGLAEQAGIAWRTVSDLERGVKLPRRDTVALLAEALALTGERRTAFESAAHRKVGPLHADPASMVGRSVRPQPMASSTPLIGRKQELTLLDRHIAGQGPPVLLVAGQPGIGKSRLLQEAAASADARGWHVLASACTRGSDQLPFTPLLQALQRRLAGRSPADRRFDLRGCAWLVRLLPELPADEIEPLPQWTLPPEQERRLMFDAVRRFLANVAGSAGTLLLLDDLQWAGQDALALLAALLQQAPEAPLRVVGAYRDTDVGPEHPLNAVMAELAERQLVSRHTLRPLAHHEATELFVQLRGSVGEAPAAEVVRRAGGVPFFLISCVRELERTDSGEPSTPGVPWDLRQSIQRRVIVLPEPTRALLAAAAVIGRVAPFPLLTAVLGRREDEVLDALENACRVGLLEEIGDDAYGFVHDVIREVVEGDLGLGRRRLLHRQVGTALERGPGVKPAEALAYHFLRAGEHTRAIPYLEQAGDLAEARYAHAMAAAHYRALVECLEEQGNGPEIVRALEKLTDALTGGERSEEALAVLERASIALRGAGDLDGLGRIEALIAHVHIWRSMISVGVARLRPTLAFIETGGASIGLARAYCALANLLYVSGQAETALVPMERAWDIADELGNLRIQVDVALHRAYTFMFLNRANEAVPAIEEAVRIAEQAEHPSTLMYALSAAAWIYEEVGEVEKDRRAAERALALAEELRNGERVMWCRVRLAVAASLGGNWADARDSFEQVLAFSRRIGLTEGHGFAVPRVDFGRLCVAEGKWEEATALLEDVLATFAGAGERIVCLVAHGQLAERDLMIGNPEAAVARLLPLLEERGLEERMVTEFILPPLAWAQLETGEIDHASATVADALRRARNGSCRQALVHALRVQALILSARERWTEAAAVLEEGLATARSMPYPHGEGRLLHAQGMVYARNGEPAPARTSLEAALAIFLRLGARKDIELVEREIAALPWNPC